MNQMRVDASLMIAGGLSLVAGSFLGWAVLLGTSVSGVDGGDGWMTLAGAIVVTAFAVRLLLDNTDLPLWFAWAGLFVAIGVAGINLIDIMSTGGDDVSLGTGMKLMVLGGFLSFVGLLHYSWPRLRNNSNTK
ncbi:MAG: hypothetical protein IH941_09665 [Acidobacteria bacterium]|nr:hypothetical protein [Acidobacteriota bacterium]